MAILDWLAVAIVGGMIHKGIKNRRKNAEEERRRKNTPCLFVDGISQPQFEMIVRKAERELPRLRRVSIDGSIVSATVRSQSGLSEWHFTVDFNDYGHISGKYWLSSDNDDSNIPEHFAESISSMITSFPEETQDDPEIPKKRQPVVKSRYCPYCRPLSAGGGVTYCPRCGKKL